MTSDKDFKRIIRERMDRTGENYTTAREHLARSEPGAGESPGRTVFPIRQSRLFAAINRRAARLTSDDDTRAFVAVDDDVVEFRMGASFVSTIPRSAIESVSHYKGRIGAWGVHGGDGVWLVNGSSRGVVSIHVEPPVQAHMRSGPLAGDVDLRELRVSVDRPDELVARLS